MFVSTEVSVFVSTEVSVFVSTEVRRWRRVLAPWTCQHPAASVYETGPHGS